VRQVLVELEEFNPHSAFLRVSKRGSGLITPRDIQEFLNFNAIDVDQNHINFLVKQYETGSSMKLNYGEY
jgi:hypothetical protein